MAQASLTVTLTIPKSPDGSLNPDASARTIAAEALQQIVQSIRDPRQTSGNTTHVFNFGDTETTGTWAWTPPA